MGSMNHQAKPLAPETEFMDCRTCPTMIVLPATSFMMGTVADEEITEQIPDRYRGRAQPRHEVRLGRLFAVSRTEITRTDYARFVTATHHHGEGCWTFDQGRWLLRLDLSWHNPGFAQSEQDPVVCVSWNDATTYTRWLAEQTGHPYRLLSEAEWEFAARAGSATTRPWGITIGRDYANCNACGSRWDNQGTAPAGSFPANAYGLVEMLGNVAEWVDDCWHENYYGAPTTGASWLNGECPSRVLRGGSWREFPSTIRPAHRDRELPDFRGNHIGFRIARYIDR
jgi:formylglycine-generating enzyme required for sulfatase activity